MTPLAWCRVCHVVLVLLAAVMSHGAARAASITQKEAELLVRVMGFLQPPPSGGTIAIAFDLASAASRQDAETIAGYFGSGLKAGGATLTARVMDGGQLSSGGFVAIIAARGASLDQVAALSRAHRVPCLTGDTRAVESSQCTIAVRSEPRVEILVNRASAASAQVGFGSAFLMMIRLF